MWLRTSVLAAAVILASSAAQAQTIQLPTFSYFTVNTTVSVPDGGTTYLGGVNRGQAGRVSHGVPGLPGRLFNNNAIGRSMQAANTSVTARIHDFEAMDEMLLGQAAGSRGIGPTRVSANSLYAPAPRSVADVQHERAQAAQTAQDKATDFWQRAEQAMAEGKPGVAKIYYRIVARDAAAGPLKDLAQSRLKALESPGVTLADRRGP